MKPRRRKLSAPTGADNSLSPPARGWRVPAGGYSTLVQAPLEWRATSVQACGMWPFAVGAGAPLIGAPLGRHLLTGATVCADPISWFRANLITAPSAFLLGLNGYGKSTLIRRMVLALTAFGVLPMVLGDLKPDYVDLIEALDGQVIRLGRERAYLNLLDITLARDAAAQIGTGEHNELRKNLLADARGRRHAMISSLIAIQRGGPIEEHEDPMIAAALDCLDERFPGVPVLADLLHVLAEAPDSVRTAAVDHGDIRRYEDKVERLQITLQALLGAGRVGEMFSRHSTISMTLDRPAVYDVSSIPADETALVGAALTACWGVGFGAVNVAGALADAGLAPRRHYFLILDELWRALIAGHGMVDRVNALTRLNRQWGVGMMMCSHTIKDLLALPDEHDRMKALGLIERSRMLICGALPAEEMPRLARVTDLSEAEEQQLIAWQNPPAWSTAASTEAPPGRGKFLLKLSGRPGIPFKVDLMPRELPLSDTNKPWHQRSRINNPTPNMPGGPATDAA